MRGGITIILLIGGFGIWTVLAPLTSAAIAPGVVKVDGSRKTVQHLEGGIIREILVREGDLVQPGQVLLRLDSVDADADLGATREQIAALETEIQTGREQLPTIQEQLRDAQSLYDKGYGRKPQLFELRRQASKLAGDIAANQSRLLALREQERKATARASRGEITAPQAGVVMNLRVHTPGGVVPPGGEILDIVPSGDKLIVEAKIQPMDIDVVRSDLPATIRFVAYKQRSTPVVRGKVTRVSPDVIVESQTGQTYFLATVEVDSDELQRTPHVRLYPGMPVEAAIVTGKRTMLAFLLQPFTDSFARAFHEE
jgi:HlyD family secretion protein/epimerase transport system membrane fusion protein